MSDRISIHEEAGLPFDNGHHHHHLENEIDGAHASHHAQPPPPPPAVASSNAGPRVVRFEEDIVSIKDWTSHFFAHPGQKAKNYVISLFPIAQWIYRYNVTWFIGDLIAGLTVGAVVIPQGMSYAKIATLPAQYGLYASFVGVMIYCFFATSKDVSIGPVAVMSLQVSKVIAHVQSSHPEYSNSVVIATTLGLLCGSVALGIGLLRLGFILEYIPIPAVMGFMTGSAFTILIGQVPALLGISKLFDTRAATYEVVVNILKNLKHCNLDAAFGLVPLFILYFARWFFDWFGRRHPKYKRVCFFASVLRNAVVIIFATLISWGICKSHRATEDYPISILKTVPRGLQDMGVHEIPKGLPSAMAGELPVSTVVLLLEHIAIAKSFGRINDYKINPNQELVAIGVTNLIGQFFAAYPATGSFSRSALKSKCGVRTPLAGVYTGVCVLVAIYGLTGTFYWIPNATLSAIIIHAVSDLMASYKVTVKFWKSSPVECVIFLVDVILAVFISLEAGIYFSVAASLVFLLLRISFPRGQFLGRVEYVSLKNPQIIDATTDEIVVEGMSTSSAAASINNSEEKRKAMTGDIAEESTEYPTKKQAAIVEGRAIGSRYAANSGVQGPKLYKWVPLSHRNVNPDVDVVPPPPGVFVFRPTESFTYPNCSRQYDHLVGTIRAQTRSGQPHIKISLGDRPWNDHGPRHRKFDPNFVDPRPVLRAVIFDFSCTPRIDITGLQALVDIRQELNKYADREVEYHFVGILSPWVRRALVSESFGGNLQTSRPSTHYLEATATRGLSLVPNSEDDSDFRRKGKYQDEEDRDTTSLLTDSGDYVPIVSTNTPFFHLEIPNLHFDD